MLGRRGISIAAVLLLAGGLGTGADAARPRTGTVVSVVDGDTVRVRIAGAVRTFHLRALDAPDLGDCFGTNARNRLRKLLPARSRVRLQGSGSRVFVFRGATFVNRTMVLGGYAEWSDTDKLANDRKIGRAEEQAQEAERGLWARCSSTPPAETPPGETPPSGSPPSGESPPADPAPGSTRMSQAQWQAFLENSLFTIVRNSSEFGGSSSRTDYTFCPAGRYRYKYESFNNDFHTLVNESGAWKLLELKRYDDLKLDEAKLELTIEQSDDASFNPNERTYTVFVQSFDDGRVRVNNFVASRSAGTCP